MSRNHAKHNKNACEFIKDSGQFNDWVITTAFYSALHFMQSYLFPGAFENPINGNIKKYQTFDQYYRDTDGSTKHGILLQLVEEHVDDNDVIDAFTSLKELCWTARYTNYCHSNDIAQECYDGLELIAEYCEETAI